MNNLNQKVTFGLLASVIISSFLAVLQLLTDSTLAYAQTSDVTITNGTCTLLDDGMALAHWSVDNMEEFGVVYTVQIITPNRESIFAVSDTGSTTNTIGIHDRAQPGDQFTLNIYEGHYEDVGGDISKLNLLDSDTVTCGETPPPPPTPAEATTELISDVENLGDDVPQSTKTSLTAPLREASNILSDENPNNNKSAWCKLDASIRQTDAAERRGDISEQQASDLRTDAEDIRSDLGC